MILLTGATGFVGKNFVLSYKAIGAIKVLVRKTSDTSLLRDDNINIVEGRLEDKENLKRALKDVDIVLHCAAKTDGRSFYEFHRINTLGTLNLIEAMKEIGVKRILYLSSQSAVGSNPNCTPFNEDISARPVSFYGMTKKMAEDAIKKSGLEYIILRPCSVYGPYDKEILKIIRLLKYGLSPRFGRREKYVNLIYIKDLVDLMIKIVGNRLFINRIYFVCDGECYSYGEIVNEMAKILKRSRIFDIPIPKSLGMFFGTLNDALLPEKRRIVGRDKIKELSCDFWLCQNDRLCEELKFRPQYSLQEGMRETIEWYRRNRWL
uniref:NAD(P)-dependent oxidoreductase n=1 Tax=candidate division WOR-3 bacterium TaxID=2052148 RepID=A0A7C4TIH7_UNCW3